MLVSTNYAENHAGTIKNLLARSPRKKKQGPELTIRTKETSLLTYLLDLWGKKACAGKESILTSSGTFISRPKNLAMETNKSC